MLLMGVKKSPTIMASPHHASDQNPKNNAFASDSSSFTQLYHILRDARVILFQTGLTGVDILDRYEVIRCSKYPWVKCTN